MTHMNEVVLRLWKALTGFRQTDTDSGPIATEYWVQIGKQFFADVGELNAKNGEQGIICIAF